MVRYLGLIYYICIIKQEKMILYSNCKINIGLNIIKKRSDGFHDIESIMYPLKSLSDVVEVVENGGSEINYSESGVIVDCPVESNL